MHAHAYHEPEVPPLENGDRLDRQEFHRRFLASPHIKKAELVEGVVYVASPVKKVHGIGDKSVTTWLGVYEAKTPGVEAASNTTVILDGDNEFMPDAFLRLVDGGTCRDDPEGYLAGPPELVVEVANSSTSYDLHQKKEVYRRNGVQEYVVLQVRDRRVRWFVLFEGRYVERDPPEDGLYRSIVFPGLWLGVAALVTGDVGGLIEVVGAGCNTAEHAAFAEKLRAGR